MPSADWKVEIVTDTGEADYSVTVIGDQVVDLTGATDGQVLTVQNDGTVAAEDPGTPGAHAATHEDGGTDEVTLAQSQVTNLVADLALKAPLASPTFTGTVTMGALVAGGATTATRFVVDTSGRVGQGAAISTAIMYLLLNGAAHPGSGSTLTGFASRPLYPSNATVEVRNYQSQINTAAASFTVAAAYGYKADGPVIGAASAITTIAGVRVESQGTSGVTNAYGISVVAQSGAATLNVAARLDGGTTANLWLNSDTGTAAGGIVFGASRDTPLFRAGAGKVCVGSLAVSNSAAATVGVGVIANKIEVFNAAGASLGFVPVYATIT